VRGCELGNVSRGRALGRVGLMRAGCKGRAFGAWVRRNVVGVRPDAVMQRSSSCLATLFGRHFRTHGFPCVSFLPCGPSLLFYDTQCARPCAIFYGNNGIRHRHAQSLYERSPESRAHRPSHPDRSGVRQHQRGSLSAHGRFAHTCGNDGTGTPRGSSVHTSAPDPLSLMHPARCSCRNIDAAH
jgi:hypothetical protein